MRYLTILSFLFIASPSFSQPDELALDFFVEWQESKAPHYSEFWIVPDLESIESFEAHDHEDATRLGEVHLLNPDGDMEIFLVFEEINERVNVIFFGLFAVDENSRRGLIALYTRNTDREVWEKMPREVYNGPKREFAEYMFEKLGRYIVLHS